MRDFLVGVFPLRFETTSGIAGAIEPLAIYGLPDDYWQTYRSRIEEVGPADVHAAALDLVRPDEALILLTGDAARVQRRARPTAGLGSLEVVAAVLAEELVERGDQPRILVRPSGGGPQPARHDPDVVGAQDEAPPEQRIGQRHRVGRPERDEVAGSIEDLAAEPRAAHRPGATARA